MGKLIELGGVTKLDIDPDRILEKAKGQMDGIVILGFEKDTGDFYGASSYADGGTIMWLLEACKQKLMEEL